LRIRYYTSKYRSDDAREIANGIKGLQSIGIKGASELEQLTLDELKHDPQKHMAMVAGVLISDKPKGVDLLAKILAGGAEEAAFLKKHWAGFNEPVKCGEDGNYPLHLTAKKGWKDAAAFLLAKGADVDAKTDSNETPLHYAIGEGHTDMATLLIRKGADVNAKLWKDLTPLHLAAQTGNKDIGMLLINRGADVNAKDFWGSSPLSYFAYASSNTGSSETCCADICELLIKKGADVNTKDIYGSTPLHVAAGSGNKNVAALLIKKGADVNAKSNKGRATPLHGAAENGHKDVTALLINKGADVNAKNNKNMTPLNFAVQNGHRNVILLLIAKGADVNTIDKIGMTPMNWANEKEIADLLRKYGAKRNEELPGGKPFGNELQKAIDNYRQGLKLYHSISSSKGMGTFKIVDAAKEKFGKSKALLEEYMKTHPDDSRGKELMEMIDFYLKSWK